jgi:hypothetical protein
MHKFRLVLLALLTVTNPVKADSSVSFNNHLGTHFLKVGNDGLVYHSLGNTGLESVNDETANAKDGNRVTGAVAVAGTGFADLNDIHVVTVDRNGNIWHTVRLGDGRWLRWGNIQNEINYTGRAVNVKCSSQGRRLFLRDFDANGAEKRSVREPDGTWSR